MKQKILSCAVLLAMAGTASLSLAAPGGKKSVIVVFNDGTPFQQFSASAVDDERIRTDADSWAYVERGVLGAVQRLERPLKFKARHVYSHAVKGFAADLTDEQVAALRSEPTVAYVEADQPMRASAQTLPWGVDRVEADLSSTRAGDGTGAVTGVNAYVIDTGIASHTDLNLVGHVNFVGGRNSDCEGHGTHVAGTIGALDNKRTVVGVAPGVPLTGVKVLDCEGSGSTSSVIKGVDWVTANAVRPAVANMSLGGGTSRTLDEAVLRSVASNVFYAVAAGNEGRDACFSSPSRVGYTVDGSPNGVSTTAATDRYDEEASFSNYGRCVDIWSPGVSILSTRLGGGTTRLSGTSMASPHTAGAAALYLSRNPAATPAEVEAAIRNNAASPDSTSKDGRAILLLQTQRF